ncbi:kinesin light chain-related [Canna indica]|uniref:Kinesin light chain-related n=1 Tax=Canna indica TaxID=4628 RepID=A0AAQ3K8K4_9LILI|nr:kinesin light chain-related [Canna indica]
MPGILMDGVGVEVPDRFSSSEFRDNFSTPKSARTPSIASLPSEPLELSLDGYKERSIEQLYDNVYAMESSTNESSQHSYGSDGEESRIDSELCHLVGGKGVVVKRIEEEDRSLTNVVIHVENGTSEKKLENTSKTHSRSSSSVSSKMLKRPPMLLLKSDASLKFITKDKNSPVKDDKSVGKLGSPVRPMKKLNKRPTGESNSVHGSMDLSEAGLDNPDLGPFLLKHARDLITSNNANRALKYALRAAKSFEKCAGGKPSLDLVMSLHVVAAIYCNMGQYEEALPFLQRSIEIPVFEESQDHALAKFSGYMQLGDTYAMLGQLESSIYCYRKGLEIQRRALGDIDLRVAETCRYLAEAYVQSLQFDEAEKLCQKALDIHKQKGKTGSLEEAADRRLMGLICDTKGDHEAALEHLVMASIALVANGQEIEVASVDLSIGDIYLALARYDEAVFAYQKALTVFKASKGENHPAVASVFVRLADLYNRIGKFKESKSYCENALRIYSKPIPGTSSEEVATGLTNVSSIYESMNEYEQALKLLQKSLKMYTNSPGQQSTIAGIEAQMGVLHYIIGSYEDSYLSFKNAITKLRACGEKKSAFFGVALNQMGLACVQRFAIAEAAELFEEARSVLEQECGPFHPDTLGVCSNLAGTYDALGRFDEAIEILEYVVGLREEKLGTASPDVDDEKRRLAELLKETGRVRNRGPKRLETLLDKNPQTTKKNSMLHLEHFFHL